MRRDPRSGVSPDCLSGRLICPGGRPDGVGVNSNDFIKMLQIYYKKRLRYFRNWCMIGKVVSQAPVAQLDRARASDARCRKFESCQVHFLFSKINI